MKFALVVFAKTIGLSNVKTRLAKDIGKSRTEDIYLLCQNAVLKSVSNFQSSCSKKIDVFIAVAEQDALNHIRWLGYNLIWNEKNSFGENLHFIYKKLKSKYDGVIIIGTDSPQISPILLTKVVNYLSQTNKAIIGPSVDGGYYLFASKKKHTLDQFSIEYSSQNTLVQFIDKLNSPIILLNKKIDIDNVADIKILVDELQSIDMSDEQIILFNYLSNILTKSNL